MDFHRNPGLCTPDESYHGLTYTKAFGKMAYTTKLVAQLMRDLGSIPGPQNSFLLNLGLETLHLRMPRHCENAQKVAEFLHDDPRVAWVRYSGLADDPDHALAEKYLPNGSCGVMCFGLKGDRETAIKFMDSLKMIAIVTHVADARSCVLHPASHTHRQLSEEQLLEAGIDYLYDKVGMYDCLRGVIRGERQKILLLLLLLHLQHSLHTCLLCLVGLTHQTRTLDVGESV